jgi:hypothetical protein
MLRVLPLALSLLAAPALALPDGCAGADLIAALPPAEAAELRAAADSAPYAQGNLWRATKDGAEIVLVGTYHLADDRHAAVMRQVAPLLARARTLLVEAGPAEEAQLRDHMARDPSLILVPDGGTLAETLPPADWAVLAEAMRDRGIPPFMASRFRPWYVSVLLAVPPCAMDEMVQRAGLDQQLIARAAAQDTPVRALEPYDTAFRIFEAMPWETQLAMIRSTLALGIAAEDQMATLSAAYFREDARAIWEYLRLASYRLPGHDRAQVDAEFAQMEEALMAARNRAWLPVIEAAAAEGPVMAAVGALHLSGREGVLALLQRAGWRLERLPFMAP